METVMSNKVRNKLDKFGIFDEDVAISVLGWEI
jgi:hypothetical protein